MIIHFTGLKNVDKPGVWLFPKFLVCLDCGFAHFNVPATELALLTLSPRVGEPGVDSGCWHALPDIWFWGDSTGFLGRFHTLSDKRVYQASDWHAIRRIN
jgi:hypothetical protein